MVGGGDNLAKKVNQFVRVPSGKLRAGGLRGQVNYSGLDCLGLSVRRLGHNAVLSCPKRVCLSVPDEQQVF